MKKIFAFVLTLIMVACMFTGYGETQPETAYDSEKDAVVEVTIADLTQVPGYDYLYYNTINRTVYYLFDQRGYKRASGYETRMGFMETYTSNSYYCEYVNGQIIEVIPAQITN